MAFFAAKLNLAWNLLLYFLKWPFVRGRGGYRQFLANYAGENLLPMSTADKTWLLRFSGCFNCGYCDTACTALQKFPREVFPGPSALLTTFSRSMPDFSFVGLDFSICEGCIECQRVCPNQVPVKEALEFIEAYTLRAGGSAR